MKILKACETLGLNLDDGISSSVIDIKDIERLTGIRINGNGSKIRRDNKPWEFFNIENIKDKNSIVGFDFSGYKTRRELIGELDTQIKSSKKRIINEESKVIERENDKVNLSKTGKLSDLMYSKKDTVSYI